MKKITIIGGGNLGGALATGLKASGNYQIDVTGRSEKRLQKFREQGIDISFNNLNAVKDKNVVILCLQPGHLLDVLKETAPGLSKGQLVISTATGVSLDEMQAFLPDGVHLIRSMPNTAAAIGKSMTCITSRNATSEELELANDIFGCIGAVLPIEEPLMQAATVLGASGIAFFLRYIRAATQGGIQMGFHPHEAKHIAVNTALGAAELLKQLDHHPEEEIDKVTTPRGCTIEGLNEMEHQGLSSAVIKGLMASYHKINNIR